MRTPLYFAIEIGVDRVFVCAQSGRIRDHLRQPQAVTPVRDAEEIGASMVDYADCVARCADLPE
jgi:hypothetical protein